LCSACSPHRWVNSAARRQHLISPASRRMGVRSAARARPPPFCFGFPTRFAWPVPHSHRSPHPGGLPRLRLASPSALTATLRPPAHTMCHHRRGRRAPSSEPASTARPEAARRRQRRAAAWRPALFRPAANQHAAMQSTLDPPTLSTRLVSPSLHTIHVTRRNHGAPTKHAPWLRAASAIKAVEDSDTCGQLQQCHRQRGCSPAVPFHSTACDGLDRLLWRHAAAGKRLPSLWAIP
jgi:hypothetical protein